MSNIFHYRLHTIFHKKTLASLLLLACEHAVLVSSDVASFVAGVPAVSRVPPVAGVPSIAGVHVVADIPTVAGSPVMAKTNSLFSLTS